MRSFTVDLPPDSLVKVHQQWDKLMYSAQQALAEVAVVSPLRINRMAVITHTQFLDMLPNVKVTSVLR